jgi:hypothetical protein
VVLKYNDLDAGAFGVGPGPARWKCLDISGFQASPEATRGMAELPQLSSLVRLQARQCNFSEGDIGRLAAALATELRELYLGDNGFGNPGVQALAAGEWPHLHTLDLRGNAVGAEGARALAGGRFPALADLRLGGNGIGDDGARAIAGAAWAGSLRRLQSENARIGTAGVEAIAAAPGLRGLTELNLAGNGIDKKPVGPKGVKALAAADWPALTDLNLNGALAGDAAVKALAAAPFAAHLVSLCLANNELTAAAVAALVGANPTGLRELYLGQNPGIGADGLRALDAVGAFPALTVLAIDNCQLPAAALEKFAGSGLVARLRRLNFYGNPSSSALYNKLNRISWGDLGPDWMTEDAAPDNEDW